MTRIISKGTKGAVVVETAPPTQEPKTPPVTNIDQNVVSNTEVTDPNTTVIKE